MFDFIRSILSPAKRGRDFLKTSLLLDPEILPVEVNADGALPFQLAGHISYHVNFPIIDWATAHIWASQIEHPDLQAQAWLAVERAWL